MNDLFYKIKNYFFNNSTIIKKFWINQFASSLLGIMITWPVRIYAEKHPSLGSVPELAALLFCGGFFCFLIYDIMYEAGSKDCVRINHQNVVYDPFKALKLIMFSYIPTIFFTVLGVIFFVFGFGDGFAVISLIMNIVIHAMYVGFFFMLPVNINILAFPISILITVIFGCLAYYLGVRDKTLRGVFGIKVNTKKE
ncbi:MAG: hypothetical protein PHW77_01155 [Eubacteriales bacterium]|nr:hypothetical protein [Eubacteriales bacterium]